MRVVHFSLTSLSSSPIIFIASLGCRPIILVNTNSVERSVNGTDGKIDKLLVKTRVKKNYKPVNL